MLLFQGQRQVVEALAFSPDGRHLAANDGQGVRVYEISANSRQRRLPFSWGRPHRMAFLPNGRLVVAAGERMLVFVEPMVDGGFVGFYPDEVQEPPHSLFGTPDGTRLLAVTNHTLHCWTMTEHVPQGAWTVPVAPVYGSFAAALSPDGEQVAVSRGVVGMGWYSVRTGADEPGWEGNTLYCATRLAWSPDGRLLAGLYEKQILWKDRDATRSFPRTVTGTRHHFTALVFHPSGRRLFVGCGDGSVRLYDPATAGEVKSFAWPVGKVRSLAVSPDGMLAAAGGDKGQVVVWDVDE